MRNFIALIFLGVFAMAQCAKPLDYWKCRLINSFPSSKEQCDCEKLLVTDKQAPPITFPHLHTTFSPDDLYDHYEPCFTSLDEGIFHGNGTLLLEPLPKGVISGVEKPPGIRPFFSFKECYAFIF